MKEYSETMSGRYRGASKVEKSKLVDEFVEVTGYHRKSAIRLVSRGRSRCHRLNWHGLIRWSLTENGSNQDQSETQSQQQGKPRDHQSLSQLNYRGC